VYFVLFYGNSLGICVLGVLRGAQALRGEAEVAVFGRRADCGAVWGEQ